MLGRLQDRRAWLAVSGSRQALQSGLWRRRGHRGRELRRRQHGQRRRLLGHLQAGNRLQVHRQLGSKELCTHTVCGDGNVEGAEGCDDGNTVPFDGCSEDCQIEPNCSGTSGCTSKCGDGIVLNEACDDGNQANGDGCSKTCQVEPGWTCTQPTLGTRCRFR